jgi:hypothetical protein
MKIRSEQGFAYELGVLLFNVLSEHESSLKITNQYDLIGNMTTLWNTLEDVHVDSVKIGFVAECENYNLSKKEAETLFEKVHDVLKEHDMSCPTCEKGKSMGTFRDGTKESCDDCLLEQDKQENPELYQSK